MRRTASADASALPPITRARAYVLAAIMTVVAVTATMPAQRAFDRAPYLPLLVVAVAISACTGGLGPALFAAGGAITAEYLVMGGQHAVSMHPELLAQFAIFIAVAAIASSMRGSYGRVSAVRRHGVLWELQERVKEL